MRHSRLARVLAAVWGVWLIVSLMEPAALHACSMHDTMHGAMSHAARSHDVASHSGGADRPADTSSRSHHSVCTCIGACCAAVVDALRAPSTLIVAETIRQPVVVIESRLAAFRPSVPEHVRPPSQGPPTAQA